jgi:hypothetical protein
MSIPQEPKTLRTPTRKPKPYRGTGNGEPETDPVPGFLRVGAETLEIIFGVSVSALHFPLPVARHIIGFGVRSRFPGLRARDR